MNRRKFEVSAVGVVEIILILVVLIALVLIFKDQLTAIVNNIFSKINANTRTILN
jgi:archaellum biogenesis protein FlaJ (TadC family)